MKQVFLSMLALPGLLLAQGAQLLESNTGCSSTPNAGIERNSRRMDVTLTLDRPDYLPGEIINARVIVTNTTPELLEVFDPSSGDFGIGASRFIVLSKLEHPDPDSGSEWSMWPDYDGRHPFCSASTIWLQPGRSIEYAEQLEASAIGGQRYRAHFHYYTSRPFAEYQTALTETLDFIEGEWPASPELRAKGYNGNVWRYAAILRSGDKYYAVAGVRSQNTLLRGNRFSPTTMGVIPTHFVRLAESPVPLAGLTLTGPGENDITISWRDPAGLRAAARVQGQQKELRVAKTDR